MLEHLIQSDYQHDRKFVSCGRRTPAPPTAQGMFHNRHYALLMLNCGVITLHSGPVLQVDEKNHVIGAAEWKSPEAEAT